MKTIIIGDVHGCDRALQSLLEKTQAWAADQLVMLGDLFDRGPESYQVFQTVQGLAEGMGERFVLLLTELLERVVPVLAELLERVVPELTELLERVVLLLLLERVAVLPELERVPELTELLRVALLPLLEREAELLTVPPTDLEVVAEERDTPELELERVAPEL